MISDQTEFLMNEAQAVFFIAMRVGYAGGIGQIKKTKIPDIPGSKCILWESMDGRWKVSDTYVVTPDSSASSGMTVIACEGKPVWTMHYDGYYDEVVTPFLKQCLAEAYKNDVFRGGRGFEYMQEGNYAYFNSVQRGSTFAEFAGEEFIINTETSDFLRKPAILGRHRYSGRMLIEPL